MVSMFASLQSEKRDRLTSKGAFGVYILDQTSKNIERGYTSHYFRQQLYNETTNNKPSSSRVFRIFKRFSIP